MSNSTSSQFLVVHSSVAVTLYVILYLPAKILGGLYFVALLRAKKMDSKMKSILINNFVPDILISVSCFGFFALHPLRAYYDLAVGGKISCAFFYVVFRIGQLGNTLAPPLLALGVFVFVKYGIKKLKWYFIACYIVFCWGFSVAGVIPLALDIKDVGVADGFCQNNVDSLTNFMSSSLYVLGLIFCVSFTIFFAIANYCYVKKNSLSTGTDGPDPMKKSLVKLLKFHVVKACFLLLQVVVSLFALLSPTPFGVEEGNVSSSVIYYLIASFYGLSILLTPIVSVVLLKPVSDALKPVRDVFKQMFRLPCHCHLPHNRVAPVSDEGNAASE